MTLLYLAAAYLIGLALGRPAWDAGLLTCDTPRWAWASMLALLPLIAWWDHQRAARAAAPPMRWPVSAGFEPPRPSGLPALGMALLLCATAGALRYAAQPLTPCWTPADLAYYNLPAAAAFDRQAPLATLEGYVSGFPIEQDGRRVRVTVERLILDSAPYPVHGVVLVSTRSRQEFHFGQRLRLAGRLATPADFADFSYREYLAGRGIHSVLYDPQIAVLGEDQAGAWPLRPLNALRARGQALINRLLPEPHAALANGILLGIDSNIPDALYDSFNLTGTSHVLVISGSNIAILVAALMALCTRVVGKRWAVLLALTGIAGYVLLVGAEAAVVRAAIMAGLAMVALALQRTSSALVSLAAAGWAMTLTNPLALWDVGFQLSSLATAGLILFAPPLTSGVDALWRAAGGQARNSLFRPAGAGAPAKSAPVAWLVQTLLLDGAVVTLAANVMVLPLIAYHFGRVSVLGIAANLLIVPVQPLILLWGSVALLAGLVGLTGIAQALLWVPWLGLTWTLTAVRWVAGLPGAGLPVASFGGGALALSYAAILAARWPARVVAVVRGLPVQTRRNGPALLARPVTLGLLAVVAGLGILAAVSLPDGRLHVVFLDVGQGDAILIQTPSGRQALIDGGESALVLANELGAVMPFWDRTLDLVALTHADADHMDAQIDLPRRLAIDAALTTAATLASPDAADWRDAMLAGGAPVLPLAAGAWVDLGDDVRLAVLNPDPADYVGPDPDNENSLVVRLEYGAFRALLTGDAGLPSEAAWLAANAPLASTVLKVGHHGSKTSTGPDFVAAVQPQLAVIQVGAENRYGHPTAETLANLATTTVLRTDRHGRIHLSTDGSRYWVETER
jgi:competence protein ComEC